MSKPDAETWLSDNVRLDVVTQHRASFLQQAIARAVEEGRLNRTLRIVTCRIQPRIQARGPDGPLPRYPAWDIAAAIVAAAKR